MQHFVKLPIAKLQDLRDTLPFQARQLDATHAYGWLDGEPAAQEVWSDVEILISEDECRRLVSPQNRFTDVQQTDAYEPFDPAVAKFYFSVEEVSWFLRNLAKIHHPNCQTLDLSFPSWEAREVSALRISNSFALGRKATAIILSGVHGDEWPATDAALAFVKTFVDAVRAKRGIICGNFHSPWETVKTIFDRMDFVVVPCANPDGRSWSQKVDCSWRKNRRYIRENTFGVDINRNYDYLWPEFIHGKREDSYFHKGPRPFSEPESANVRDLISAYRPSLLIDIHTAGQIVLYSWGNDPSQHVTPSMNFLNPHFDGTRGLKSDGRYSEFLTADAETELRSVALAMTRGIWEATATDYGAKPAVEAPDGVTGEGYSGMSQDYAFSRHLISTDPADKTLSFTLEIGQSTIQPYNTFTALMGPEAVAAVIEAAGTVVRAL